MNIDLNNLKVNHEQSEINSKVTTIKQKMNKEFVEIFSAVVNGKDVSRYGKKVDTVISTIKDLGDKADSGDANARAELNAVREIMIETPLMKRLNLFSYLGTVTTVAQNEELRYKVMEIQGKLSQEQASSGSFPFGVHQWRTSIMETQNISGGHMVDYREMATNLDATAELNEQVITDITNQVFYKVYKAMYDAIKNASGLKNFTETSGINKAATDEVIKKAKRFGKVSLMGDYTMIAELENFVGFTTTTNVVQFSEAVMEEIRKTGLVQYYKGCPVIEIPNTYNVTKLNSDGDFYETYLPEGLLFAIPVGATNALQIGFKGGLTSMVGQDINLAANVTRYDLQVGTVAVPEYIPQIGLISDSAYDVDKR